MADRGSAETRRELFAAARSGAPAAIEAWIAADASGVAVLEHAASHPPLAPGFAAAWARRVPPRTWGELLHDAGARWRDEEDRRRGDWVPPSEAAELARRALSWLLDSLERAPAASPSSRIEGQLVRIEAEPELSRGRAELLRAQGELRTHDPSGPLAAWVELLLATRTFEVDPASCERHLAALRRHVEGDAGAVIAAARFEASVALRQGRYAAGVATLERGLAMEAPTAAPTPLEELVWRWWLPSELDEPASEAPSDAYDEPAGATRDRPDAPSLSTTLMELAELAELDPSAPSIASAVDELVTIARWAERDTPELARGIGALWATLAQAEHEDAPELRSAFERAIARLAHAPATEHESALDVVARQLRDRGLDEAAAIASTSRWAAWMDASIARRGEHDEEP